jgi:hypothetical protein
MVSVRQNINSMLIHWKSTGHAWLKTHNFGNIFVCIMGLWDVGKWI